ncbi:MAG: sporulation integral membrane protein YtvI [Clostridia bacterium]|nr:sporulation integral membrane protein YtvI [Clostridia bacterium]
MTNEITRKKNFLIRLAYFMAVIAISVWICRKGLFMMMPFVIALVVALLLQPIIRLLTEKLHMPKGLCTSVLVFLFYIILGLILLLASTRLFDAGKNIILSLPSVYSTQIEPVLTSVSEKIRVAVERVDPAAAQTVDGFLDNFGITMRTGVMNVTSNLLRWVGNTAITVPGMFVNMLITIFATIFFAQDLKSIRHWTLCQLSPEKRVLAENVIIHLKKTLVNYILSYGLILLITFTELSIGLWIMGFNYFLLIAAAIAILDILPVVGCGTALIPWTIVLIIYGDYRLAMYMGIMYIIITVVRNFIEPKIVGNRVGLHPIVTLSAMVAGTKIYGGVGLLGLPIAIAMLVSLNKAGAIRLFKPVTEEGTQEEPPAAPQAPQTGERPGPAAAPKAEAPAPKPEEPASEAPQRKEKTKAPAAVQNAARALGSAAGKLVKNVKGKIGK